MTGLHTSTLHLLSDLLSALPEARVLGGSRVPVRGLTADSRRVTPGHVFVAVRGHERDGHDYIPEAVERGAVAVVCENPRLVPARIQTVAVKDARRALGILAAAFYGQPSSRLKMVGVTGTNGKTTVAFLARHLLGRAGLRCGLLGTVHYEIGDRVIPAQRTTPDALQTQEMLAAMVRADCGACVMEASSHALTQDRVADVDFDVAAFTNLTRDHLDYHGGWEAYFQAKRHLFVRADGAEKKLNRVINLDDPHGRRLAEEFGDGNLWTYGLNGAARIRAQHITLKLDETRFDLVEDGRAWDCRTHLVGRHNVYNALAAVAIARSLGADMESIAAELERAPAVPGRLERIQVGQNFGVFVDYAHTDDALSNVLRTLREVSPGRLWVVFGCGGDRDPSKRPAMGAVAARYADETVLTSDNPRRESPQRILDQVLGGYLAERTTGVQVEVDRARAIERALLQAGPGDQVLIAGKGHETYQEFADTVVPFDDREQARSVLAWLQRSPAEMMR